MPLLAPKETYFPLSQGRDLGLPWGVVKWGHSYSESSTPHPGDDTRGHLRTNPILMQRARAKLARETVRPKVAREQKVMLNKFVGKRIETDCFLKEVGLTLQLKRYLPEIIWLFLVFSLCFLENSDRISNPMAPQRGQETWLFRARSLPWKWKIISDFGK